MIRVENIETWGFRNAIRGMRNPMNSWDKSDSGIRPITAGPCNDIRLEFIIGNNDIKLMRQLYNAGNEHRKYLRQIFVSMDITAPLYWWKEYDTYKVGTVSNSCSTMHKIHAKEFTLDDFSHEHLIDDGVELLKEIINSLNECRKAYINYEQYKDIISPQVKSKKDLWWTMIQLLPSSYNQKRTVTMNYENVVNMIHQRKYHKLDEWRQFVEILENLDHVKEIIEIE